MSVFVGPFNPVYLIPNVKYPVTETQISAKNPDRNDLPAQSKELTIESTVYDYRGRVVVNQKHTMEVWA